MRRILSFAAILLCTVTPSVVTAHPGHGADGGGYNLQHYFSEPIHLVTGLGLLVVSLLAIKMVWCFVRSFRTNASALPLVEGK